ncbi:MAG: molybdopterin molybdotransferase MoeA [Prolixibacteraceae bacterium]|nr:molybdopterin molybdotransferase MoeA [Prolixibacteraceae bacterium]MBN2774901.1 molybdopterin molybdotransferase MoeA [Prolixibacteraceae bacterium]
METDKIKILSLEEALEVAFANVKIKGVEKISFKNSLGRVLAEDVFSDTDMPPFNKSAMDGFACRKKDLSNELTVLETIPAGNSPTLPVAKNQCSKIMTGAEVPEGADTVIMVEHTQKTSSGKIVFIGEKTSSNICSVGEDLHKGSLVIERGTLLKPQHLAILAAVGCIDPEVYKMPEVGIISTGSELIEPGETISRSKIRNSNGHQLVAQFANIGINARYYGIVLDDLQQTRKIIGQASLENDLTIISGGVSVGDFDFVKQAIQENGFKILLERLTVKPGQHTTFAIKEISEGQKKYIIGLPGNPVSSFIQFELFVKPLIYKFQGKSWKDVTLPLKISQDFRRKKSDRTEFLPVILTAENEVELIKYNGSAHIHAYHNAFGFISMAIGKNEIKKGETVYVRPL